MKKILILTLMLFCLTIPAIADATIDENLSIIVETDMYMAFKPGIKYEVNNKWAVVSTFGANMIAPSQMAYSLYGQFHSRQSDYSFNIDVNIGFLQGVLDLHQFTDNKYFYINPGLAMHLSYPVHENISIGAMGGMLLMLGYDQGYWGYSLEPYAGITLTYSK